MVRSAAFAVLLVAVLAGCVSVEHADYGALSRETGIELSKGPMPGGAEPVAMVRSDLGGFYLFGVIPFYEVTLERGLRHLAVEARAAGAEGVALIDVDYRPASVLDVGGQLWIWFPWWASLELVGQGWRCPPR